jgi:thiosulfate reductase cytochrome b subunit
VEGDSHWKLQLSFFDLLGEVALGFELTENILIQLHHCLGFMMSGNGLSNALNSGTNSHFRLRIRTSLVVVVVVAVEVDQTSLSNSLSLDL